MDGWQCSLSRTGAWCPSLYSFWTRVRPKQLRLRLGGARDFFSLTIQGVEESLAGSGFRWRVWQAYFLWRSLEGRLPPLHRYSRNCRAPDTTCLHDSSPMCLPERVSELANGWSSPAAARAVVHHVPE